MADLVDVLAYLAATYPHEQELSNARLTKMVYLSDWKHAVDRGSQVTSITWFFDNFGPFVWDVFNTVKANGDLFEIDETENAFGTPKTLVRLRDKQYSPVLTSSERGAIGHVIDVTKGLYFQPFIRLVYSTYPIRNSSRYSFLNLIDFAEQYRDERGDDAPGI